MNAKQKRFVDEYLIDLNATQAAERAGYSAKTARAIGARLLTDVDISTAIEKGKAEIAERAKVDATYVVSNLREVVERCMQRAPVMVKRGREVVQLKDEDEKDVWQFDARGANGALNLLGKHLGMYVEKHEVSTPKGTGVLAVPVPIDAAAWAEVATRQQAALEASKSKTTEDGM